MPTREGEPRIPYGAIKYNNATGINIEVTTAGTPVAIGHADFTAATGVLTQATVASGSIQLDKAGSWAVFCQVSGTGEASDLIDVEIYAGASGATATGIAGRFDFPSSGMTDVSLSCMGVIEGAKVGDLVIAKLDSDTNADSLQVRAFNLVVQHLAGHTGG